MRKDHEALEAQVGALRAVLATDAGTEDRRATLQRFIRAIGPDLELHLRKEEEVLFPALQKLAPEKGDAILFLKEQHGQLRTALRQLAGSVCGCEPELNWKETAHAGQKFVDLLEEHEKKEEQLLIRVLEISLKPNELIELAHGFHQMAWKIFREGL
ncbi:MAG: hemerythrin domain-containing protein [Candidatus Omnitrophica bacterium]|nr:hemerythrin domain-containing protein [Candidatus Omnitrophota bacterium]